MLSTHVGYGFVFAYGLSLLFGTVLFLGHSSEIVSLNVYFVLFGAIGGFLPDVDRWEQVGFSHRRTLHYVLGYGLLAIVFIAAGYVTPRGFFPWVMGASCFFAGSWLHSFMDVMDGFWADDVNKGVYEHLRKRWIRARDWIPFARWQEWSLQSFSAVLVIAVSPQLAALAMIPGWAVAALGFFAVWLFSTVYEFRITVPKRWEMEKRAFEKSGLEPRY